MRRLTAWQGTVLRVAREDRVECTPERREAWRARAETALRAGPQR